MENLGLFGYPVKHSLSSFMHNAALKSVGLYNESYELYEVKPNELKDYVSKIKTNNLRGVNVTIPYKEQVIDYLDEVTDVVKSIGACNTIINKNGYLVGDNTDGRGFIKSIKEKGNFDLKGQNVFIVGAGGASRAIIYSLLKEKINKLFVSDIDNKKADNLVKYFNTLDFGYDIDINVVRENMESVFKNLSLFINATPCGMGKNDKTLPLKKELINKDIFVYDIVYNRETELLRIAHEVGAHFLDGSWMLVYQGALSFEAWTGMKASIEVMRKAIEKHL